jgi:hypothetical protein
LWSELKDDFQSGMERLKWASTFISDRLKTDIVLFKLLNKITELEKSKTALYAEIGQKVHELNRLSPLDVCTHPGISKNLRSVSEIDSMIEELKKQASAVSTSEG